MFQQRKPIGHPGNKRGRRSIIQQRHGTGLSITPPLEASGCEVRGWRDQYEGEAKQEGEVYRDKYVNIRKIKP